MVVQALRVVLWLTFFTVNAFAWEGLDYFTYFGTTDDPIIIAWTAGEGVEKYQIRALHKERNKYIEFGTTAECEYTIVLPRSGHYIFEVRSLKLKEGSDDKYITSEWAVSNDPQYATVDGEPRAWWVYGYVAPPGIPEIL